MELLWRTGGVKSFPVITACLIAYTFVIIYAATDSGRAGDSLVSTNQFNGVLVQSLDNRWGITAFMVSQLIDVTIFIF
jgi:hypothetical protein